METGAPKKNSNIWEIFSVILICFGMGTSLSAGWMTAFNIPFSTEAIPQLDANQALLLGWANSIQQFFFFFAPWLWLCFRSPNFRTSQKEAFQYPSTTLLLVTLFLTITSFGVIEGLSWLNQMLLDSMPILKKLLISEDNTALVIQEKILSQKTILGILQTILIMSVIPGFLEEIFFRGVILHWLKQKINPHLAIWMVGIFFSMIHFEWEGFIPRCLLGAGLGYLYQLTGKLWYPILAHVGNNLMSVVLFHYFQSLSTPEDHWSAMPITWVMSSILFLLTSYFFYQKSQVFNKL